MLWFWYDCKKKSCNCRKWHSKTFDSHRWCLLRVIHAVRRKMRTFIAIRSINYVVSISKKKKNVNKPLNRWPTNKLFTDNDCIYLWHQSMVNPHTAIDNISIDKMCLNSIEILDVIIFFSSLFDILHFLRIQVGLAVGSSQNPFDRL